MGSFSSLIVLTAVLAPVSQGGPDYGAETIRSFVVAFSEGNLKSAAKFVQGGKVTPELEQFSQGIRGQGMTIEVKKIVIQPLGAGKPPTEVLATVTTASTFGKATHTETEAVKLALAGKSYLIVPPKKEDLQSRKQTINSLAILFTDGMTQIFADAKASAKRTRSLSNVKQLGLATIMFATDQDDVVKTTAAGWHKAIFPYCKNGSLFKAPGDTGKGDSYTLNANMANKALSSVKVPSKTVLVYEGAKGKLAFRHGGKAAVCFCDGSARLYDQMTAKNLIWKP